MFLICIIYYNNLITVQRSWVRVNNAKQRTVFPCDRLFVQGNHANPKTRRLRKNTVGHKLRALERIGLHCRQGIVPDIFGDSG
jgi:hypothetical protein